MPHKVKLPSLPDIPKGVADKFAEKAISGAGDATKEKEEKKRHHS